MLQRVGAASYDLRLALSLDEAPLAVLLDDALVTVGSLAGITTCLGLLLVPLLHVLGDLSSTEGGEGQADVVLKVLDGTGILRELEAVSNEVDLAPQLLQLEILIPVPGETIHLFDEDVADLRVIFEKLEHRSERPTSTFRSRLGAYELRHDNEARALRMRPQIVHLSIETVPLSILLLGGNARVENGLYVGGA